jgi:hypothetical protein
MLEEMVPWWGKAGRRWVGGGGCIPLAEGGRRPHGLERATRPSGAAGLIGPKAKREILFELKQDFFEFTRV